LQPRTGELGVVAYTAAVSSPSARVDGTGRRRKARQLDDDRILFLT
jgi:hypothetical protein